MEKLEDIEEIEFEGGDYSMMHPDETEEEFFDHEE